MSMSLSGTPRVKRVRPVKVRSLEPTAKRNDTKKKKSRDDELEPDEIDQAWRKR